MLRVGNIERSIDGAVARVTLNRPEKLNAFFGSMREELVETLRAISADETIRSVVVTGAGRAFCSGGDVEAMAALQERGDTAAFRELLHAGRLIVTTIRDMPQIVIAAVNGVAAGAGCNLALACDYRVASEAARFSESFVRIGLHPDWGGTYFLPRLVGASRAIEILASGRMIEAAEALEFGMVDRVVPAEELLDVATALAKTIAAGPSGAIRDIKTAVYESANNDLAAQLDLETENQVRAFESADSAEGIRAFLEKRTPHFPK